MGKYVKVWEYWKGGNIERDNAVYEGALEKAGPEGRKEKDNGGHHVRRP